MKKILFITLVSCICQFGISQSAFDYIKATAGLSANKLIPRHLPLKEYLYYYPGKASKGSMASLKTGINLDDHFSIEMGLMAGKLNFYYFQDSLIFATNYFNGTVSSFENYYECTKAGIPISILYSPFKNHHWFTFSGGILLNKVFVNKVDRILHNSGDPYLENIIYKIRTFNIDLTIGVGLNIPFGKHFALIVSPDASLSYFRDSHQFSYSRTRVLTYDITCGIQYNW